MPESSAPSARRRRSRPRHRQAPGARFRDVAVERGTGAGAGGIPFQHERL